MAPPVPPPADAASDIRAFSLWSAPDVRCRRFFSELSLSGDDGFAVETSLSPLSSQLPFRGGDGNKRQENKHRTEMEQTIQQNRRDIKHTRDKAQPKKQR